LADIKALPYVTAKFPALMELPAVQFNFEMARDKENTANVLYRMKKKSAK